MMESKFDISTSPALSLALPEDLRHMEEMDNIIASVFFEFIGAFVKWSIYAVVSLIKGKKVVGFLEIWSGKKNAEHSEIIANGVSNIYLGIISVVLLILILIRVT